MSALENLLQLLETIEVQIESIPATEETAAEFQQIRQKVKSQIKVIRTGLTNQNTSAHIGSDDAFIQKTLKTIQGMVQQAGSLAQKSIQAEKQMQAAKDRQTQELKDGIRKNQEALKAQMSSVSVQVAEKSRMASKAASGEVSVVDSDLESAAEILNAMSAQLDSINGGIKGQNSAILKSAQSVGDIEGELNQGIFGNIASGIKRDVGNWQIDKITKNGVVGKLLKMRMSVKQHGLASGIKKSVAHDVQRYLASAASDKDRSFLGRMFFRAASRGMAGYRQKKILADAKKLSDPRAQQEYIAHMLNEMNTYGLGSLSINGKNLADEDKDATSPLSKNLEKIASNSKNAGILMQKIADAKANKRRDAIEEQKEAQLEARKVLKPISVMPRIKAAAKGVSMKGFGRGVASLAKGAFNNVLAPAAVGLTVGRMPWLLPLYKKAGLIPQLRDGAKVNPTKDGTLANVAEGGKPEVVMPLKGKVMQEVGGTIAAHIPGLKSAGGMQYKSSQQMEEEQKAAENQARTANDVATIVRLLEEQNKLAKQKKPESLLSKILGFLGMMATTLLPKIISFIKSAWKGIRLVGKILKPIAKILSKLGGPLLRLLGMLGKGLFGLLGKLGKGAGALLSGAKAGAAKVGEKVKDFTGKGKGGKAPEKAPKTRRLGLGRDVGNAGKAAGRGLKGGLKTAGKMLGRLSGPLTVALAAYDAYEAWNDEDLHKRAFGLKDGEKANTGQKIQAGMAGAGAGILNIGSGAVGLLGSGARAIGLDGLADSLDKVADFIEVDPATLIKAYNAPLKTLGGKLLELTDGIPVLGDAVKGIGNFIESSPMLKGAVNWLDEHNPLKVITEGVGKTIDWFNSDTKWEDLKSGFKAVGGAITDTCCNVGAWFGEKAQNIGSWIGEKANAAWDGVKSGFGAANEWIGEKADSAWNFIKENNPIAITQRGFEEAKTFFDKNGPGIWNFIKENNPIALVQKGFQGIKGFFAEKFGSMGSWFGGDNGPFQPIFNFLGSIGTFFSELKLSSLARKLPYVPFQDALVGFLEEKGLAKGGLVKASRGGTLAVIGEGGEDEAVLPLSKLAQIIYESFKIHDALVAKRSSALGEISKSIGNASALTGILGNATGTEEPRAGWAIDLLEEIKQIGKNIDLMTKMIKLIKVDGVTLGELVENKMLAMAGPAGAATQAAAAAQQGAGMVNPASPSYGGGGGYAGDSPSGNAAPFAGGKKAPGIGGRYGAIAGKRDELVLAKNQRALNAKGKHMDWSQATNNPGNVGNTDQGGTYIFPDLQSGLKAQRDLLKEKYTKNKKGEKMTLMQMCQKYTPTCWQTALPTWSKYSGIGVNEVPNLDDPNVMARLMKAIHIAEGSASWVSPDEVDYALGLKQMPEGYQKKDYRQLTEQGKALLGQPSQGAASPQSPQSPQSPGASPSVVPQAKFMPAANGDPYKQTLVPQMPVQQPAQQSSQPSLGGSVNNILQIAQKNASISGKSGYSKKYRLSSNQFDCSSFVGRTLQEAGYNVGPISDFTTPKMPAKLGPKGLNFPWTSGLQGIQPGDIAWRNGHTEISIGNGKTIGALNSTAGVGVHPLSWGKYTGYWRPTGAVSGGDQQGQEQQGQSASPQGASPSPQIQPVQPAAGQAPSFVPRPSAPPAGAQPMANPAQSPSIPGVGNPAQQTAQYAQQYQYPPSKFGSGKAESLNASKQQVANLVIAEAKRQGIDPQLALAIAKQESNFNQKDVSRAGAVGVMQIMPADVKDYGGGNVYDINDNIRLGVTEIKKKLQLSGGDVREALLRYNWGDGNVRKWKRGARRDMPKEAREYADRVLGHIQKGTVGNILQAAGEAAPSGGINPYAPQQGNPTIPGLTQGPPVQGMPPQQGPAIPGLSGIYAAMTANAMQRGVKYKMGARNSRTGRIDCSGWTIEMGRQIMQGVQDPAARARLGQVLAGGTAEGIISKGLQMQGGQSASLDPSQIKEGTMIGIKARPGKHGSDRPMGIGHIVTTFRDPNTGRMMVSESTSNDGHGRSGVITTDYEQWYREHSNRTMWGVDTGALIGGQFDAGNVKAQMEAGGAQQTQYGMGATPQSGPQIQASQQGMVNEQAAAYYAQGGGGGANIDASTNIAGGAGGGANKPSVEMVLNKDPMGWIVLQGNAVH